jgi:hypothetical protein
MKVEGNESTYDWHDDPNLANPAGTMIVPSAATLTGVSDVLVAKGNKFPTPEGYPYGEELSSGQSITVKSYGGVSFTSLYSCLYDNKGSRDKIIVETGRSTDFVDIGYDTRPNNDGTCADEDTSLNWDKMNQLQQGDQTTLVWEASSGGKTQTIFKYSVQGR